MNRRKFLGLIGIAAGGCALTCAGLTTVALLSGKEAPDSHLTIGFPETRSGEASMANKILVAYASAAGSTGGVAEAIGKALAENGAAVDVLSVQSVADIGTYQAVVLGSAIHGGKWLPGAVDFLKANQEALRSVPTALFLVCMMAASSKETTQKLVADYLNEERALVPPVAEGRFVGALFPTTYPLATNIGLRFFLWYCGVGVGGGDYRDEQVIRAWAANTYPLLTHPQA